MTAGGVAQSSTSDGDGDKDAEPDDSMANAARITYGQPIGASPSSPNDTDYYAVDAVGSPERALRLLIRHSAKRSFPLIGRNKPIRVIC